jgi:methylenetetrahydrofolate dehydrogenase (NADP+)/methenyltetrahydrofolate cyclohydrolase
MAKILDGKIVADKIIADLESEIQNLKAKNLKPTLAVISIGDNPVSKIYLHTKQKRIEGLNFGFNLYEFLEIATKEQVIKLINELNAAIHIDGILIQLPIPYHLPKKEILNQIKPEKDIDALISDSPYKSPTAQAILEILKFYQISVKNKKVVIVGRGDLVGKPLAKIVKEKGAEVILSDKQTKDLSNKIRQADILVTATGQKDLIKANMVSKKTIVIDAGTSIENGLQIGDTDFQKVSQKVRAITPPYGGVGPVTIACLIKNLIVAAKHRQNS